MYLPQSQYKANLFTNGSEFKIATTGEIYSGYYFETYRNERYTGKTPQDGTTQLLLPLFEQTNLTNNSVTPERVEIAISLNGEYSHTAKPRLIPQSNPTQPTPNDYVNGLFTRYFCKKNNELKYMEIDQPTYTKLKSQDTSMAWDLYTPTLIQWYIAGEIEKIYNVNKSIVNLVEVEEKWYGFSQYFKQNYAKYFAV